MRAGLQSAEAQEALSQLSRAPAVRLLASADHANFPLLWDKRTAARFNWAFVDATTYAPYTAETRELPSLLVGRRQAVLPRACFSQLLQAGCDALARSRLQQRANRIL